MSLLYIDDYCLEVIPRDYSSIKKDRYLYGFGNKNSKTFILKTLKLTLLLTSEYNFLAYCCIKCECSKFVQVVSFVSITSIEHIVADLGLVTQTMYTISAPGCL